MRDEKLSEIEKKNFSFENNNDFSLIEQNNAQTTTKNSRRLFVNSRERMNNNDYMYSNTRSK
jgi:hypothetical protein